MKQNLAGLFAFFKPSVALLLVVASLVLLAGCSTVPVTGRSQFNLMSPSQEAQLGLASFDTLKKEMPISKDVYAKALVQKVGQTHRRRRGQGHAQRAMGIRGVREQGGERFLSAGRQGGGLYRHPADHQG